jgi:hypothetical protein
MLYGIYHGHLKAMQIILISRTSFVFLIVILFRIRWVIFTANCMDILNDIWSFEKSYCNSSLAWNARSPLGIKLILSRVRISKTILPSRFISFLCYHGVTQDSIVLGSDIAFFVPFFRNTQLIWIYQRNFIVAEKTFILSQPTVQW